MNRDSLRKKVFIYICCLFFADPCFAQLSDSLLKAIPEDITPRDNLKITPDDKAQVLSVANSFYQPKFKEELSKIAFELNKDAADAKDMSTRAWYLKALASYYMILSNDSSIFYYRQIVSNFNGQKGQSGNVANAFLAIATNYAYKEKYDSAMDALQQGINISSALNDTDFVVQAYRNYSFIYSRLKLYNKSLEYGKLVLQWYKQKDRWDIGYIQSLLNNAAFYAQLFVQSNQQGYSDSARQIVRSVMRYKVNDAALWFGACYYFLGYLEFRHNNYLQAINMFDSSMMPQYNYASRYTDNYDYSRPLYKAVCLIELGRYDEGRKMLDTLKIGTGRYASKQVAYEALYRQAAATGNFKDAFEFHKKYKQYSDSLDLENQKGKVFEAEQKYDVSRKQASINRLQIEYLQEKNAKRTVTVAALLVFILLSAIIFLYYVYNRRQLAKRVAEGERLAGQLVEMELEMEARHSTQHSINQKELNMQRKIISKEMHDEISGSVATLRFLIHDQLNKAADEKTKELLEELEDEAGSVYRQVRDFMHRLWEGNTLQNYDVIEFLQNLSVTFNSGSSLLVATSCDEDVIRRHYTSQHHAEAYLFIKEAVTNCMKHATASKINIEVSVRDGISQISITDNGKGMSEIDKGLGLDSMGERMRALGGEAKFWSDGGMHIFATFPVDPRYNEN